MHALAAIETAETATAPVMGAFFLSRSGSIGRA